MKAHIVGDTNSDFNLRTTITLAFTHLISHTTEVLLTECFTFVPRSCVINIRHSPSLQSYSILEFQYTSVAAVPRFSVDI